MLTRIEADSPAGGLEDYAVARQAPNGLQRELMELNPIAGRSPAEGLEETLTLIGSARQLRKTPRQHQRHRVRLSPSPDRFLPRRNAGMPEISESAGWRPVYWWLRNKFVRSQGHKQIPVLLEGTGGLGSF
jgi:hypothetical protein